MSRNVAIITAMVFTLMGCGPAREPSQGDAPGGAPSAGNGGPLRVQEKGEAEITAEKISKDIVGKKVEVGEVNGFQPSTEWTFEAAEFRRIDILERHATQAGVDLLVFMLTRNNPQPGEDDVQVSGQLRLHYERQGAQWLLRRIDNVTFRYSVGVAT